MRQRVTGIAVYEFLSSLIGYGLIVAVPIISNRECLRLARWLRGDVPHRTYPGALYLDLKNKAEITQHLLSLAERSLPFLARLPRSLCWCGTIYQRLLYRAVFFSLFDPCNSV